jgi:hypothetical protein
LTPGPAGIERAQFAQLRRPVDAARRSRRTKAMDAVVEIKKGETDHMLRVR